MKRLIIATVVVLTFSASVFASGLLSKDMNGNVIQYFIGKRAYTRNDSKTGTKVFQTISSASFAAIKIDCTDGDGAAKACRAYPNAGTVYYPLPTGSGVIWVDPSTTSVKFTNISGASATTIFNTQRM